jgi:beta-fructofuranosidase
MHDADSCFPVEADPRFHESLLDDERAWVSFRDPFYYRESDRGWLLTSASVDSGPLVRRGCVGCMEEVSPNQSPSGAGAFAEVADQILGGDCLAGRTVVQ